MGCSDLHSEILKHRFSALMAAYSVFNVFYKSYYSELTGIKTNFQPDLLLRIGFVSRILFLTYLNQLLVNLIPGSSKLPIVYNTSFQWTKQATAVYPHSHYL